MIKVLYLIAKIITFPGTLLKAFLEHCACRMTHTVMENDYYFQSGEMCGHVEHDLAERKGQSFTICFFPFIVNLVLGLTLAWAGSVDLIYLGEFIRLEDINFFAYIFLYIGICLLTNLFPSTEDFLMFKDFFYGKKSKNVFLKIILAPLFTVFFIGTKIEKWGLSLITTCVFVFFLPNILTLFVPQIVNFIINH